MAFASPSSFRAHWAPRLALIGYFGLLATRFSPREGTRFPRYPVGARPASTPVCREFTALVCQSYSGAANVGPAATWFGADTIDSRGPQGK